MVIRERYHRLDTLFDAKTIPIAVGFELRSELRNRPLCIRFHCRRNPPLFIVGPDGKTSELVNYRVRSNRMIVDRLFAAAELVLATATPNAGFASSAQTGDCVVNEPEKLATTIRRSSTKSRHDERPLAERSWHDVRRRRFCRIQLRASSYAQERRQ
jgi:hypothetical protein